MTPARAQPQQMPAFATTYESESSRAAQHGPSDSSPVKTRSSHRTSKIQKESLPISFFFRAGDKFEVESEHSWSADTADGQPCGVEQHPAKFCEADGDMQGSSYGVESLDDVLAAAARPDPGGSSRWRDRSSSASSNGSNAPSQGAFHGNAGLSRSASDNTLSLPLTPVLGHSPGLSGSAVDDLGTPRTNSLRSFRLHNDDEDDGSGGGCNNDDNRSDKKERGGLVNDCQTLESKEPRATASRIVNDPGSRAIDFNSSAILPRQGTLRPLASSDSTHPPQLIMPSMMIPTRRPFTERGAHVGRLKIMMVGARGCGKMSLIKAMVRGCADIVHVDPLPRDQAYSGSHTFRGNKAITNVLASTRAYPSWWAEIEEGRNPRRRKNLNDTVLERNICFIAASGESHHAAIEAAVRHTESLLQRTSSFGRMSDAEAMSVVAGNGSTQVDVALVFISPSQSSSEEARLLKRLGSLTNLVPIIGRSEGLTDDELVGAKTAVIKRLYHAGIRPFLFGRSLSDALSDADASYPPFVVAAACVRDEEEMDASVLMAKDYQPLPHSSELESLIHRLFDPANAAWLRHAAAQKFVRWRSEAQAQTYQAPSMSIHTLQSLPIDQGFHNASAPTTSTYTASSIVAQSASDSAVIVSHGRRDQDASSESIPTYALSRLSDQVERSERMAQVRLARWAVDLERALRHERERFAAVHNAERERWLRARLEERIQPTADISKDGRALIRIRNGSWGRRGASGGWFHADDPLGLIAWHHDMRARGRRVLQLLGGASLLGAAMIWIVRHGEWYTEAQSWKWRDEWWLPWWQQEGT